VRRGELWLAQVGRKRRPVLVLTRPEVLDVRADIYGLGESEAIIAEVVRRGWVGSAFCATWGFAPPRQGPRLFLLMLSSRRRALQALAPIRFVPPA